MSTQQMFDSIDPFIRQELSELVPYLSQVIPPNILKFKYTPPIKLTKKINLVDMLEDAYEAAEDGSAVDEYIKNWNLGERELTLRFNTPIIHIN